MDDLWADEMPEGDDIALLFEDGLLAALFVSDVSPIATVGGRRPPMSGAPNVVRRQRTEEEEEQLRLLKLLNDANNAKKLKRWQEAENENARQKHNKLLFSRLEREADIKKSRGQPDVKKANKEIAQREALQEQKRQEAIRQTRLKNLEKARAKRS